jgi:hypothetical protein
MKGLLCVSAQRVTLSAQTGAKHVRHSLVADHFEILVRERWTLLGTN